MAPLLQPDICKEVLFCVKTYGGKTRYDADFMHQIKILVSLIKFVYCFFIKGAGTIQVWNTGIYFKGVGVYETKIICNDTDRPHGLNAAWNFRFSKHDKSCAGSHGHDKLAARNTCCKQSSGWLNGYQMANHQ